MHASPVASDQGSRVKGVKVLRVAESPTRRSTGSIPMEPATTTRSCPGCSMVMHLNQDMNTSTSRTPSTLIVALSPFIIRTSMMGSSSMNRTTGLSPLARAPIRREPLSLQSPTRLARSFTEISVTPSSSTVPRAFLNTARVRSHGPTRLRVSKESCTSASAGPRQCCTSRKMQW